MRTYRLGSPEAMRLEPPLDPPDDEPTEEELAAADEARMERALEAGEDRGYWAEKEAGWGGSNYP